MFRLIPTRRLVASIQKENFFFPQQLQIPSPPLPHKKVNFRNYRKNYKKGEIWCWATLSCIYDVLSLHVGQKLRDLKTIDEKVTA